MPRKTLRERARAWATGASYAPTYYDHGIIAFIAGHRANRLTAKERAVVEAAKADVALFDTQGISGSKIIKAVHALERNGRK